MDPSAFHGHGEDQPLVQPRDHGRGGGRDSGRRRLLGRRQPRFGGDILHKRYGLAVRYDQIVNLELRTFTFSVLP